MSEALRLFAPGLAGPFGAAVARALDRALDPLEEREFEDGEHKARPMTCVRGTDAYVICGMHGDAQAGPERRLIRLLFLISTLRDHGAARVTALIPYLAYARKDRRTKARDPLTLAYVARLLEAAGADRVAALEPHNRAAFETALRIEALPLDLRRVMLEPAAALAGETGPPVVVASPDPGGVKRAQLFREALEARLGRPVGSALVEKRRSAGVVSGDLIAGDVSGARVLLVDDLIASGGTLIRAARAALAAGADSVRACAAHGLFSARDAAALTDPALAGEGQRRPAARPAAGGAGAPAGLLRRPGCRRAGRPPARGLRCQRPDNRAVLTSARPASARYARASGTQRSGVRGSGSSRCRAASRARSSAR